ncbi:hypothetical protein O3W44_20555 [Pantoea sp. LMR881]|uniref:PDC sensor domain-containing protein n=1 Tax=Pantoea sp. LMR881 TaxID=3014336 RepID=UPI0022AF90E3|nr:hypothetical protein [Pantoea sp. LMR881]MCZ4060953.1 hypothetical protein [Pantoea sp. LMR881]
MDKKSGGPSSLMHTPLGRSMAVFLLLTGMAVTAVSVWSVWKSGNSCLPTEKMMPGIFPFLARQAEDAFLQVDITLTDAVRQLRLNGADYAATPAFARQIKEQHGKLPQLHGLFIYDSRGNWIATSGNYIPAKASNADRKYFIWHRTHTGTGSTSVRSSGAARRVTWSFGLNAAE